ncbi:MAG: NUDIX hydrolase [Chloroflexi bacterium]|nr:MAG: NUDIX hydrolase [Chloroflexota bacterium]
MNQTPSPSGSRPAPRVIKRLSNRTVRLSHSAGGVPFRHCEISETSAVGVQVALIATAGGNRWQLPKGRLEPGEEAVQAAIREVEEETGLRTVVEVFLRTVEYSYTDTYRRETPETVHKRVDFYLLRVVGGELSDLSFEVDGVLWATPEEALQRLTFSGERECVRQALEHWT